MFKTPIDRLLLVVVLLNLCAVIGCHRGYYRRQADAEAQRLIREKSVDARWSTADGTIDIDPQSRMFDPFSSDHPPIPPDDASSHQFMHRVDGKEGYPHWHANGDSNFVEAPEWRQYLPMNENGEVVLTLDRAYQLALIHSPDLQQQRETLYLSALDVSLERFGFDSQLFTGYNTFFTTQGRLRNGTGRSTSRLQSQIGANGGGLNIEKLGITGSNFAVGLANTILFNFAGANTQSATSLIDFSLIQPLLRGAGRERIMESLTQAERTLLANVRQMERFRRGFYLDVAIGRDAGAGPNRGGNFLNTPGSASSNAGGFVGLLETKQQIKNQEYNVRQLESVLELFKEFFKRQRLDAVQLKNFESSVYTQQRILLNLTVQYQTSLDRYKIQIGLPPDLDVVIKDDFLDRFKLISDNVSERLIEIALLRKSTGVALNNIDDLFDDLDGIEDIESGKFAWPDTIGERVQSLNPFLARTEATLSKILSEDEKELEADLEKLESTREGRIEYLAKLKKAIASNRIDSSIQPDLLAPDSIQEAGDLRERLTDMDNEDSVLSRAARIKQQITDIKAKITAFDETEKELSKVQIFEYIRSEFQEKIPGQLSELNSLALEISLLQALARSNSIEITDVSISSDQAIEIARCMRRDWMNARASHVDNWRNIEFVADQLEAQVDLVFEGDIGNNGDNPFKLRYETGQLRAGFRFDSPITRLAERNNYRAALINYQQSRRQYYQFEDNVKRNLREIIRNLDRNKILFELNRRGVQVDIENVEINRFELEEPVAPNAGGGGGGLGSTTALNLTQAINRLNSSQDNFLSSWVQFEVLRRSLDFDMGTMQIGPTGVWMDPGKIDRTIGIRAASMMGIELDCQFCQGVTTIYEEDGSSYTRSNSSEQTDENTTLPFESDFNEIEPANDSPEVDGVIIPAAPTLNEPETGMRQRRGTGVRTSGNGSPNRLFTPVKARSTPAVRRSWLGKQPSETRDSEIVKPAVRTGSKTVDLNTADPIMAGTTSSLIVDRDSDESTDFSLGLPSDNDSKDSFAMVATRIADRFNELLASQATQLTPVTVIEEEPNSLPTRSKELKLVPFSVANTFRPIPPLKVVRAQVQDAAQAVDSQTQTDWDLKNYSLGNALERFQANDRN